MGGLIEKIWYKTHPLRWLLSPLSALFRIITVFLRSYYRLSLCTRQSVSVPVIIIGNISIGGTGKTPFVIWLAKQLQQHGFTPGIISRGYGGASKNYPLLVNNNSDPVSVGDESIIIARHTGCPMAVSPKRTEALTILFEQSDCDIIISDDGLQHYSLARDMEIIVVDAERRFGNKCCIPAGPLRESLSRLQNVDFIVYNGTTNNDLFNMILSANYAFNLLNPSIIKYLTEFSGSDVHGIAGIGNPKRFFYLLTKFGINVIPHEFDDHYLFQSNDVNFDDDKAILMTEKDAAKCQYFACHNMWYIPITASVSGGLKQLIIQKLLRTDTNG